MKIIRVLGMVVLGIIVSVRAEEAGASLAEIRGNITIKDHFGKIPQFRVLYHGKETVSNAEGFVSIPVNERGDKPYSLLICKDIQENFDKTNTVRDVSITNDTNYRFLTYVRTEEGWRWVEDFAQEHKKSFVIPENCVVVLMDSLVLERVGHWDLDLGSKTLKLPTLCLKSQAAPELLERASAKSLLKSLDSTSFYESIKEEIRNPSDNPKVRVSLNR